MNIVFFKLRLEFLSSSECYKYQRLCYTAKISRECYTATDPNNYAPTLLQKVFSKNTTGFRNTGHPISRLM